MKRTVAVLLMLLASGALVAWVTANTEWKETSVPVPARGEAATNPFYAVQRFTEAVGARAIRVQELGTPPADAVVVLSDWYWSLSRSRADAIKYWVTRGGRLVVDDSVVGTAGDFERWSGVSRAEFKLDDLESATNDRGRAVCRRVAEPGDREGEAGTEVAERSVRHWVCDVGITPLEATRSPVWSLADDSGSQAVRQQIGRGSVTVVNAAPFTERRLFDGDHHWLFVEAAQLAKGDVVYFLSEGDSPSLLALLWQKGAPLVVLGLALVAVMIWRRSDRHGPLAPTPAAPRRSLAEQIRGTGQFLARHGADALRSAAGRALDEAASRRIDGYLGLEPAARVDAVAHLAGLSPQAIEAALHGSGRRTSRELRSSLALLETARRRLTAPQEAGHGVYGH